MRDNIKNLDLEWSEQECDVEYKINEIIDVVNSLSKEINAIKCNLAVEALKLRIETIEEVLAI